MIVEFTGCTGSGKTTLSRRVIDKLVDGGFDVVSVHQDFFQFPFRLTGTGTLRNLIMDVKAWAQILKHFREEALLFRFVFSLLRGHDGTTIEKLNILRSVCRKLGTNYRIVECDNLVGQISIVDEGVVHSIHNLFVGRDKAPDMVLLDRFLEIVPLPDILIYVRAPLDVLIERAKKRKDLTRRARGGQMNRFIANAEQTFEGFLLKERVKGRVFILDNVEGEETFEKLAEKAAEHILEEREHVGSDKRSF